MGLAALLLPGAAQAVAPKVQFSYTGGEQSYVVPPGVALLGVAAEGGHGGGYGGYGGREGGVGALLPATPGQRLFVEVGSAGVYGGGAVFGGGGAAGPPPPVVSSAPGNDYASSGGGASDVRTCSILAASCLAGVSSLSTRLIVGGGGGGEAGIGNNSGAVCGQNAFGAGANNFQYPPGNPGAGPVPIITGAGIVYPGRPTGDQPGTGVTPAGGGSNFAGTGGAQAGCPAGSQATFSDSVAGSKAVGPVGGTGGNASSLGPMGTCSGASCADAGSGGGGGGGYFGGGGGATGLDRESGMCGACNSAGGGQGGGGGSSFVSNRMMYPVDQSGILGTGNGIVVIVPAVEIAAPANGAVYTPGQIVDASWSCGYDSTTGLGIGNGCSGTVANGSPINTSLGTHTFTVSGLVSSNGPRTVSASVTYTVTNGGGGGKQVSASAGGFKFTLKGPSSSVKKGGKLTVTVTKTGKGKHFEVDKYKYYLKGTHKNPILVTKHAGTFSLSLRGLESGEHRLGLVITLNPTKHGKISKTVTLTLPFTIG